MSANDDQLDYIKLQLNHLADYSLVTN